MATSIWPCIRLATEQRSVAVEADEPVFLTQKQTGRSFLSAEGRNRVLIFPGTFNPPHIGHLQLLDSVLQDAMGPLAIRAVIVFPHDDYPVRQKVEQEELPFCLEKKARVRLWKESGYMFTNTWFYTDSKQSLKGLQRQLQKNLKERGIQLSYMLLYGPDWMSYRGLYHPSQWHCKEAITSDISRLVDFRLPSTLRQLPGCRPWINILVKEGSAEGENVSQVHQLPIFIWKAATLNRPTYSFYFIPRISGTNTPPSSTNIRKMIIWLWKTRLLRSPELMAWPQPSMTKEELQATVLSPAVLREYCNIIATGWPDSASYQGQV